MKKTSIRSPGASGSATGIVGSDPDTKRPIIAFLEGEGRDGAGRTAGDVLALNDRELEWRHDFIQWLFPLATVSSASAAVPVLTPQDAWDLRASHAAQQTLSAAAERMLDFYRANSHWTAAHDHNHLRITRIIKSLRLLCGDEAADAFRREILQQVAKGPRQVSQMSLEFWMAA